MAYRLTRVGTLGALLLFLFVSSAGAQIFKGTPKIGKIDTNRWELLEDLYFIDKDGETWKAPIGYKTDGASIPWPLWSIIGSPFTGDYVGAAIIHDVYCDLKSRDWKLVHRTFYDAMIADKVPVAQAKIMYFAVYRFGPKWVVDKTISCPIGYACGAGSPPLKATVEARPVLNVDEMQQAKKKIESENLDLAEIEHLAEDGLFSMSSELNVTGKETNSAGQVRHLNEKSAAPFLREVLVPN